MIGVFEAVFDRFMEPSFFAGSDESSLGVGFSDFIFKGTALVEFSAVRILSVTCSPDTVGVVEEALDQDTNPVLGKLGGIIRTVFRVNGDHGLFPVDYDSATEEIGPTDSLLHLVAIENHLADFIIRIEFGVPIIKVEDAIGVEQRLSIVEGKDVSNTFKEARCWFDFSELVEQDVYVGSPSCHG